MESLIPLTGNRQISVKYRLFCQNLERIGRFGPKMRCVVEQRDKSRNIVSMAVASVTIRPHRINSAAFSNHAQRHVSRTPAEKALQFNNSIAKPLHFGLLSHSRVKLGICARAENGGGGGDRKSSKSSEEEKELDELRGKSTMPDRFKYLTKEVPSPPLLWPWLFAVPFLIYAWRSVLWELLNWRKLVLGILQLVGYLLKLLLALVYRFIGDPITYTILYIEMALHAIRSFYSSIVTSAPIPELTFIILLASTVLAIGETASPNSIKCQPYLLSAAGIIGYGAVSGVIIEPIFWLMLVGFFSFSRFFKERDYVTSALPAATVLASVGEPWVRVLAIISFTALAILHHSNIMEEEAGVSSSGGKVPLPLLGVALAIGIRVAAKWAGYRHLTWMIV